MVDTQKEGESKLKEEKKLKKHKKKEKKEKKKHHKKEKETKKNKKREEELKEIYKSYGVTDLKEQQQNINYIGEGDNEDAK